jgi:rare lipoprotein A
MARVTNVENGKSVDVYINDYGPNEDIHPERIIDLSSYAFQQLAPLEKGTIVVKIQPL